MLLNISIVLVTIALIVVCLLMILLVLMQRPKQEGLGAAFGAGVTDQIWGSQTTNVLQKGTVTMGVLLFVLSLSLAMMKAAKARESLGAFDKALQEKAVVVPPAPEANSTITTPIQVPPAEVPVTPGKPVEVPATTPEASPSFPVTPTTPVVPPAETPVTPTPAETPAGEAKPAETAPATPPATETPAAEPAKDDKPAANPQ